MSDLTDRLVLVVDDEEPVRTAADRFLDAAGYSVLTAGSVDEAEALMGAFRPEVVCSDLNMPGRSGLDLLRTIMASEHDIAFVMVTHVEDRETAQLAIDLGVHGYVVKPFGRNELLINVANAVRRRDLEEAARNHRTQLERAVARRTAELHESLLELEEANGHLARSREETLRRLAMAAEFKDPETAEHLERMSQYADLLARRSGLDRQRCELIRLASPMHDVGKIGIPDAVLMKTGRFDERDREVMNRHPEIGHRILSGSSSELLDLAATIALTHHERWDGNGYPQGLAGEDIQIEGRIVALADVFDALGSTRRYKEAFSIERILEVLQAERGRQFDPDLVDLLLEDVGELADIRRHHEDPTPHRPDEVTTASDAGQQAV